MIRSASDPGAPALGAASPCTYTRPARISARARLRARPSTIRIWSRRVLGVGFGYLSRQDHFSETSAENEPQDYIRSISAVPGQQMEALRQPQDYVYRLNNGEAQ